MCVRERTSYSEDSQEESYYGLGQKSESGIRWLFSPLKIEVHKIYIRSFISLTIMRGIDFIICITASSNCLCLEFTVLDKWSGPNSYKWWPVWPVIFWQLPYIQVTYNGFPMVCKYFTDVKTYRKKLFKFSDMSWEAILQNLLFIPLLYCCFVNY